MRNNFSNKTILVDADSLCFSAKNDTYEVSVDKLMWKINKIKKSSIIPTSDLYFF